MIFAAMNPPRKLHLSPVAVWVMICALLNASGWLLSALRHLSISGYSVVLVLACAATVMWWRSRRPVLCSGFRIRRFKRAFPLAFVVVAALAIAGGCLYAPSNYDALAYRTPRVLHWLAEGQWHWIHTDFHRLNTRGCGIEWITAPLILLTGTDRFLFLINVISFLLLPGLCFSVMTRLGVRKRVAWHWMWVLPTGYCYLLQAASISNDLFGATLALAALDFALRAARERCAATAWLSILAAALMTSGKGYNLLLLIPWGLAMLPVTGILLRRPLPTMLVGALALVVSLLPTSLLNAHYCGDWKGLKAEPVNFATGEPLLHLGVNGALVALHNVSPTFNPLSGAWNGWMQRLIPADLAIKLAERFDTSGARFTLGEIQMEETAGLGFGVSLLLLPVLLGRIRLRWPAWRELCAMLSCPANLILAGVWLVTLYFFTQLSMSPTRFLAPFYVLLIVPVLRLPRASELLRRPWWRRLALFGFVLAALLVIATPARPLWPAQTLLRMMHAENTSSPWFKRVWTVYSVYGARSDGFAPVRAILPPNLKTLGLVTFDDPETSLWRPFGSQRIYHVTRADDAQSLRHAGIQHVLINEYVLTNNEQSTLARWLARIDAEVVSSLDLSLRATRGPTRWHLARLRPVQMDGAGHKD